MGITIGGRQARAAKVLGAGFYMHFSCVLLLVLLVVCDTFSLSLSMALKGPVKLVYFNLRGRAELPRLILHAGGQKFDDCPGGIEKSDYEQDLMFGQVPLLIDGDKKIVQTRVIARYLATKLGLCGNGTEDDVLLCDQLFEGTEDIYEALWPACAKYRGGNSEQLEKVLAPGGNVHKYLVKFDKMLTDRTFLLGDSLTYADLALYNVLTVTSAIDVDQYLGQHFPNIRKHYSAVEAHDKVKAYVTSDSRRPPFEPWTF